MRRPGTLLLLAIVLGAFGAALVYRQLRALRSEIEAAKQPATPTVDVVVAAEEIPLGTRLEPKLVKVVQWPQNIVPESALNDPKAIEESVARVTIYKDQPLTSSQLLTGTGGLLPMMIPEGMRAMSVRVDDVTGVSGFITPSSRVDVLVAGQTGEDESGREQRSKLVLQNIRVLAIGKSIEQREDKPVEVPTVTLLVSPAEAEKLTLAARYEPVRLALRNYGDMTVVGTPGVSTGSLFEARVRPPAPAPQQAARPAEPPRPPKREPAPERRPRHSVEVLLGETVTRQDLY
jgi:pilus assembly protein CpaB